MVVVTLIPEAFWVSERAEVPVLSRCFVAIAVDWWRLWVSSLSGRWSPKILDYLGLGKGAEPKRNRAPPFPVDSSGGTSIEPYDAGWLEYEKDFINVQLLW